MSAKLLCMNADSERCVSSLQLLRANDFDVEVVKPEAHRCGVWSNFVTMRKLMQQAAKQDGWTYFFEDDLMDSHPRVSGAALREHENVSDHDLHFLGICGPAHFKGASSADAVAGRCTHAFAVNKTAAKTLLRRSERLAARPPMCSLPSAYFDVTVDKYCRNERRCSLTPWATQSPQARDHWGYYHQDRARFPASSPWWKLL